MNTVLGWLWQNVALNAIGFAFDLVPWPVWIIVAGLVLGWAWRTFGWQGLVGAGLAILTLGAYRQGWRDNQSRLRGRSTEVIAPSPVDSVFDWARPKALPKRTAKKYGKRTYDADTNTWKSLTSD